MYIQCYTKVVVALCLCFLCFQAKAQPSFLQNVSYDSLLTAAKASNKLMFVAVQPRGRQFPSIGIKPISPQVVDRVDEHFVSGVITLERDNFNHPIYQRFHISNPMYLFMDEDGYPLLTYNMPIHGDEVLLRLVDSVETIAEGQTMGKMLHQYHKGVRTQSLLRNLLKEYQALDHYVDMQVLQDYVAQLRVQELSHFETVVFLLESGPIYNSSIYRLAYFNRRMVDSVYKTLPNSRRMHINRRISQRTFREALDKKNASLAREVGQFVGSSWQPHHLRAQSVQNYYPMEYSRLMRDTATFIQMARSYYTNFYYRVAADSSNRLDFAKDHGINIPFRGRITVSDSLQNARLEQWLKVRRRSTERTQIENLNYGANCLLDFGVDNPDVLFDAIRWVRKSIALDPNSGQSRYTLAKVLYRAGFFAEAEAEQQNAVELYKNHQEYHERMKGVLEAMQSRSW